MPDTGLRAQAERLVTAGRVSLGDLAIAFDESTATAADVYVEGVNFFPRMRADIERAESSVHIIQFGFKPGKVGDLFGETLAAKARTGVPVRVVVDRNGSDPERGSRQLYDDLLGAGVDVCTSRGTQPRAPFGPLGGSSPRAKRWNLAALGHIDHRKMLVIDGRIAWVGGAGIEDHFEDGRFHDLFVRVEGPVVAQLQLVFVASFGLLGGNIPADAVEPLFPEHDEQEGVPAVVLHNAPGRFRPITDALAASLEGAETTLDVINPYVADRGMIGRIARAAERGVRVRMFVPETPNNWACGAAQRFHHGRLLGAGVEIFEYPTMLHAKAVVRDGEDVLAGTCNLEAWSLKRFFEINLQIRSRALAQQFDDRFLTPAVDISAPGRAPTGFRQRAKSAAFAAMSPLL